MKGRRSFAALMAICILLTMSACSGKEGEVYVQSVEALSNQGGIAPGDRFSGMVVSENVTEIMKDENKTIAKLSVREGDDVKEGQALFSYDTEELQLSLDKLRLEQELLEVTIENLKSQIEQLEKDRARAGTRAKLEYTVQLQTAQVDLKEAELKLKAKKTEVEKAETLLKNATVCTPVTGRVQSINEGGTDNSGKPVPFITIQQAGSYRVKGTINELQRGGIIEGNRIRMFSRTDEDQTWRGTVTLVDYESPSQGSGNDMIYGGSTDEMSSSSKYPFYVELDSSDGLILGQHLYLELDTGDEVSTGLNVSSAFVCFEDDGTAYVWAENGKGKLEKRIVEVGEYNVMLDSYEVLRGLSAADYIAFPDETLCKPGVPTTHVEPVRDDAESGVA